MQLRLLCLCALLVFGSLKLQAQQTESRALGLWYATIQWDQADASVFKLLFESPHLVSIVSDEAAIATGTWSCDEASGQFSVTLKSTQYHFTLQNDTLTGRASAPGRSGFLRGWREKNAAYDSTEKAVKKAARAATKIRLSTDYGNVQRKDIQTGTIGLGVITQVGRPSFNIEFFTVNATKIDGSLHYSSNWIPNTFGILLFAIAGKDSSGKTADWPSVFLLPQALTNWDFSVPLGTRHFCLDLAQRTDCYLLNGPAKIVPTSMFGVILDGTGSSLPLQLHAHYCIPWVHGLQTERKNYISAGLNFIL